MCDGVCMGVRDRLSVGSAQHHSLEAALGSGGPGRGGMGGHMFQEIVLQHDVLDFNLHVW